MGSIGNREGANVDSVVGESSVSPNTVSKATKSLKNADTNLYRIIGAGEHMSVIPALWIGGRRIRKFRAASIPC